MDDVKFVDGLYFKEPRDGAPDFIRGALSIQKEKLASWLEGAECNEAGYINLDIKISKGGKPYISINDWKPDQQAQPQQQYTQAQQQEMDTPLPPPQAQAPMDDKDCPF